MELTMKTSIRWVNLASYVTCHGRGGEREVLTHIWLVCPHVGCLQSSGQQLPPHNPIHDIT